MEFRRIYRVPMLGLALGAALVATGSVSASEELAAGPSALDRQQAGWLARQANPLEVALQASGAADATRTAAGPQRPNVLFIAIDDMNDWIDTLDSDAPIRTPNITALAERGMLFTQAFAPGTSCTPSRTSILTGMSPFKSGMYSHSVDWREHPQASQQATLPHFMRNNGYATVGSGKLFHAHSYFYDGLTGQADPEGWNDYWPALDRQMPDQIVPATGRYPDSEAAGQGRQTGGFDWAPVSVTDEAMGDGQVASYVIEQLLTPHTQPSFIAAGIYRPHLPWYAPDRFFDMYPVDEIELPAWRVDDLDDVPTGALYGTEGGAGQDAMGWILEDNRTDRWRLALQGYMASASYADFVVGQIIDALDRSGKADNTIIVLWSDHGFHLGEKSRWGKMTLWERTARVPFIIVAPGVTTPGSRTNEAVSLQSIFPTLAELTGLERPDYVDGTSLVPLLRNPSITWDDVPLTTHSYGNYTARDDRFRYIIYSDGSEELYDLVADPHEFTNLVDDPAYDGVKERLRNAIPEDQAEPQVVPRRERPPEDELRG